MKKNVLITCLLIILIVIGVLNTYFKGFHFSIVQALPSEIASDHINIVGTEDISNFGIAVLFEDLYHKTYGMARIKEKFGFLYGYAGGTHGYRIEEDKPFQAMGIGNNDNFLVAVITAEHSNIAYIALGNHLLGNTSLQRYELSLDEVKANPEHYRLKEVAEHHALFVMDQYTEESWTVRAFDREGKLIADKLFAAEARYINW